MATENTKPTQDQLLKAVADVLDEALAIYEDASGNDVKKAQVGIDDKMDVSAGMSVKPKPVSTPGLGDADTTAIMAKEGDKDDKKDKEKEGEEDDEKLMHTYKSLVAKMESRGLMQKMENDKASVKKSEAVEAASSIDLIKSAVENDLRKAFDEKFSDMANTIKSVAETVKKIASTPKERKGVTGYTPLKKNEGPTPLRKGEVMGKLLELKKSGDPRVDTLFITRVEQGRLTKSDEDRLKSLGVVSE